ISTSATSIPRATSSTATTASTAASPWGSTCGCGTRASPSPSRAPDWRLGPARRYDGPNSPRIHDGNRLPGLRLHRRHPAREAPRPLGRLARLSLRPRRGAIRLPPDLPTGVVRGHVEGRPGIGDERERFPAEEPCPDHGRVFRGIESGFPCP